MKRPSSRARVAFALLALSCGRSAVVAQDLEPRFYTNVPIGFNFVAAGYGYSEGNVLFDPSIALDNADLTIDGKPVTSENGTEAVEQLRGKPGSPVALTIAREGLSTPLDFNLKREVIRVASVRTRTLEPGYGYLRITQFQNETGAEVREKLRRMVAKGALRPPEPQCLPLAQAAEAHRLLESGQTTGPLVLLP